MTKTPEQMAEDWLLGRWYAVHDPTISGESKVAFLAGYKAGQEHPFQFQTKMWVDPIGPQDRWISVKERLPEDGQDVLACVNGQVLISYVHGMKGFSNEWGLAENGETIWPSHWMPLPEPPKE
jgi:hypothetical protein